MIRNKVTIATITLAALIAVVPAMGAYAQTSDDSMMMEGDNMMAGSTLAGPIAIGGPFPLSGDLGSFGGFLRASAELAVEDFNAYLAENGAEWWLELDVEDTATDPVTALEKVQSLHAKGITNLVGMATSGSVTHVKGYTDQFNMLVISCCSTDPNLAIVGDSVYRFVPDDRNQGAATGKLLVDNGITAVVPVWRGDTYGDGLRDATATDFEERGGFVHPGVRYAPKTTELSLEADLLAKYVQETIDEYGADKVAVWLIAFDERVRLLQSAANHDVLSDVRWFAAESVAGQTDVLADKITSEFIADAGLTAITILPSAGDQYGHVTEHLAEEFGEAPNAFAYPTYDSVWVLGKAIMKADSADSSEIKKVLPSVAAEYKDGSMSTTELNDAGDLILTNYQIMEVIDNKWVETIKYSVEQDILTAANQPTGEIEIGSLYPLTGRQDATGYDTRDATQLGADDFNKFLERLNVDWRMKIVSEDSATSPTIAVEKVRTLLARDIDIVIGPRISSTTLEAKSYADTNDMMLISCCSTAPALAIPGDSVFRLVPDDTNQGVAASKLLEVENIEVIVPIWLQDAYGNGLQAELKKNFENRGYIVGEGIPFNPDSSEFGLEVSALAEEVQKQADEHGKDKVAVFIIAFGQYIQIMESASNYDILKEVRWFGAETLTKRTGVLENDITRDFVINSRFSGVQVAEPIGGEAHDRVEAYFIEKNGAAPITLVYHAYDIAWLVGLSILQSGATDANTIKDVFHDVAANYKGGAIGDTTLNESGDLAAADYAVWEISEDGEWVRTGTYIFDDDSIS